MNSLATYSSRKMLLAIGAVAILAVGALSLSALFAHADTGPVITTTVTNSSNAVVTSAPIGSTVMAGAVIASSTASTPPTGTVNFSAYNNLACSGTPTVQSGVSLVNGMASSSAATVTASGLSYLVNYNGDASNTPSVSPCMPVSPTSGSVTVTPSLSANNVNAGSSVTAGATLGGNTGAATGTLSYNFYTNNTCTLATSSPVSVTVANGTVPTSAAMTFNQPGTYYLQEVYSGDNANAPATSTCGSQVLTVNSVTPTQNATTLSLGLSGTSVVAGTSVNATATLGGQTGSAGGTVAYTVYSDNACTSMLSGAGTMNVTNGTVPNSTAIIFNSPGNYYWRGVYSGDTNNAVATSSCTLLAVTASSTGTGTGTGTAGTISGRVYNDANQNKTLDSSEAGIAGATIQLSVLQSNWWMNMLGMGKYTQVATMTTDANGNYTFSNLGAGTYKVAQVALSGWQQEKKQYQPLPLAANGSDTGVNFGNFASSTSTGGNGGNGGTGTTTNGTGTISGTFYNDLNNNGTDDNEPGLSGWTVWLHRGTQGYNSPVVATATTDASGHYSFNSLAAGTYFVEESEPSGWNQTSDDTQVVLGTSQVVNFSNVTKASGNGGGQNGNDNNNGKTHKGRNDGWNGNGAPRWSPGTTTNATTTTSWNWSNSTTTNNNDNKKGIIQNIVPAIQNVVHTVFDHNNGGNKGNGGNGRGH